MKLPEEVKVFVIAFGAVGWTILFSILIGYLSTP
jgi:hypothetical protein